MMMEFDMTAQLAPILWGVEFLLLVSAGSLVAAYVLQEWRRRRGRGRTRSVRLPYPRGSRAVADRRAVEDLAA